VSRWAGIVLVAALTANACGAGVGGTATSLAVPTTAAAGRTVLDQLLALATSGNLNSICDLGSGTCPHDLRSAAPGSAPTTAPEVMGTWVVEPVAQAGGALSLGGRAFALCGVDGLRHKFYSEVLVFDSGAGVLRAINAVFWTGARIATSADTGVTAQRYACP
jgi:hypothetical protein